MPFEKFERGAATGFALGYLAYDDKYFYFAAKIADSTPDGGTMRFETRDDDQFFYPREVQGSQGQARQGRRPRGERRTPYETSRWRN